VYIYVKSTDFICLLYIMPVPDNVVCSFLQLIIPTLPHVRPVSTDAKRDSLFWKHESSEVETVLMDFMLDVLLLPYK